MENILTKSNALKMLECTKKLSTDRSTQTSTLLLLSDETIVVAPNSHTYGIDASEGRLNERPVKYSYIEHSERNAIYKAAAEGKSTKGAIAYLSWFPCAECARALVQSGISKVFYVNGSDVNENKGDWAFEAAKEILVSAGVELQQIK